MLKKLLADTAITAAAFLVASVVGLLLVPVLIGAYGVGGFGLVMLARVLLPSGALGMLDFGIGEIATQAVAAARGSGDWNPARGRLRLLTLMTAVLVVAVAFATYALAAQIGIWFKVPPESQAAFAALVRITALALPMLFASLAFEGIIKGFERFSILRATEVILTLAYAAVVVLGVWLKKDFTWPAWAFLGMQVGKAMLLGAIAWRLLPGGEGAPIDGEARRFVWERSRLFFTGRILGTLQQQAPTLLIGFLIGPVAVGVYEAILRLPRFVKSALSIIGTTLMPAAMRLEAAGDHDRLQAIGRVLISVLPAIVLPPIAVLAMFSGDVLNLWLGREFVPYAAWLAAYLTIPALNTMVSFQHSALLGRPEYLRRNNWIAVVQTVLQMALSLALVGWLAQGAFILGQAVATVAVFAWQIRLGHSYLHPPPQLRRRFFAFVFLTLLGVAAWVALVPQPVFPRFLASMLAALGMAACIWLLAVRFFLTPEGRRILGSIARIAARPFVRT